MDKPSVLRRLPSAADLLESPPLKRLVNRVSRNVVVDGVRSFLDDLRTDVQRRTGELNVPPVREIAERIADRILRGQQPEVRSVVNATGLVVHSALGCPPLPEEAIEELIESAREYASVALDLASGERRGRFREIEQRLCKLTGAESALVVNSHPGAVWLVLAALAAGRDVLVSRSQLGENETGYRVSDAVTVSGAVLREVGSANLTRGEDYDTAAGEATAAILRVRTTSFFPIGLTGEASLEELVRLGRKRQVPVVDDLGSSSLIDLARLGLAGEPNVAESIRTGADLVLCSGEGLVGGPQCGLIFGRRALVERIAAHPLIHAQGVSKLTALALAATVRLYGDEQLAVRTVPLLQLLETPVENLKHRAERLQPQLAAAEVVAQAEALATEANGGSTPLPHRRLPSYCLALTPARGSAEELSRQLRLGHPSVLGRVEDKRLLLDLRSVFPRQDQDLVDAVAALGSSTTSTSTVIPVRATEEEATDHGSSASI
ncbi:MAG: L-seryl-tRNA(Sec) selenium transferase [Pirellulales bacterium]